MFYLFNAFTTPKKTNECCFFSLSIYVLLAYVLFAWERKKKSPLKLFQYFKFICVLSLPLAFFAAGMYEYLCVSIYSFVSVYEFLSIFVVVHSNANNLQFDGKWSVFLFNTFFYLFNSSFCLHFVSFDRYSK